jgi:catechol 2,3-dioxygenase-like lactoylglutathione lyase family enzyme
MKERANVDYRIEAITLPVSDVDRARDFYVQAGWNLDLDTEAGGAAGAELFRTAPELVGPGPLPSPGFRIVQLTPAGSGCSITFGTGTPQSEPGSYVNTYLVVSDIEAAHRDLKERGIEVSDIFHWSDKGQTPGPSATRGDYESYATFADPDGNVWLVQEVPSRASAG